MKAKILLFTLVFAFGFLTLNAQIVSKGDKILNFGLGIGNSFYSGTGYSSTIPPVSASLEVIINDDLFNDGNGALGIGGYAGYFGYKYNYRFSSSDYNWKYSNIVLGPRGNVHYYLLDKLDTYAGILLGYNIVSVTTNSTSMVGYTASASGFIWSGFIGGRYYFLFSALQHPKNVC